MSSLYHQKKARRDDQEAEEIVLAKHYDALPSFQS